MLEGKYSFEKKIFNFLFISFISIAFFRSGLYWLRYVYYPIIVFVAIWTVYVFFKDKIYTSYKYFIPFILLSLIFIGNGIVYFDGMDGFISGELLKICENFIFIVLLLITVNRTNEYNLQLRTFKRVFYLFPIVFAILGITKFMYALFTYNKDILDSIQLDFLGASLVPDYNIYALYLLIGLILILYQLYYLKSHKKSYFYISFVLLIFAIIFSGSRRGFIVLFIICTLILFYFIIMRGRVNADSKILAFLSFFFIVFMLFFSFGFIRLSAATKFKLTESIGASHNFVTRDLTVLGNKYNSVWGNSGDKGKFNPKNPKTWSVHEYNFVYPLSGDGVDQIPKGSIGYKLDSNTRAKSWGGDAYYYTNIIQQNLNKGDSVSASVYCYVSDNFDGTWVKLSGEWRKNIIENFFYNLDKKGKWQKLSLSKNRRMRVYLYLKYSNDTTFKNMNGYVIFAHPEYEIIRHSENKRNDKQEINGKVRMNSLFGTVLNIPFFGSESKLASPRIKRWLYAWEIFRDYSFTQKLIGNGFEYLELYNEKFYPNQDKIDYPHNPIISSFLYSGIIGGLVYIWFLLTSLYYYYKYRKEFGLVFILYLVTGFFIFFSYNSHFSFPAFSMLSVFPFVINYYKKEIENNDRTA